MTAKRNIKIFDTTLRDGEQSPGASMNLAEKLEVAHALHDLGVDVIEAGFPIASPGDFEAVQADRPPGPRADHLRPGPLQRRRHRPRLGGPARRRPAAHPRLPGHQRHPSRVQAARWPRRRSSAGPSRACSGPGGYCDDVEFSPEDAARTELDFLAEVVEAADRGRRHDGQHSRHGRLRRAQPVRRRHPPSQASTSAASTRW